MLLMKLTDRGFSLESVWKCQGFLLSAHLTGRVGGNKIQSRISLEISGPPPLFTHDRKGERATRFRVESVWKCLGLILSAHMTGRVRGLPKISVESVLKC